MSPIDRSISAAAITLALIEVVRQANRPPSETKKETTVIEAQAEIAESGQQPSV